MYVIINQNQKYITTFSFIQIMTLLFWQLEYSALPESSFCMGNGNVVK